MKDRLKKVLKRAASGLLAVLLAVCLVGTPRAKAVVSEGALLGSLFGSLLVSMGYSWAADNFDAPTFGEAIYDLIKECDEERDTGIQLLLDSGLSGLTAVGNGKLTFSHQWVKLANSFAEWFQEKFFVDNTLTSPIVEPSGLGGIRLSDGGVFNFTSWSGSSNVAPEQMGSILHDGESVEFSTGVVLKSEHMYGDYYCFKLITPSGVAGGAATSRISSGSYGFVYIASGTVYLAYYDSSYLNYVQSFEISGKLVDIVPPSSLTAEKPQEVHYPDVAEDGSQVYEITVDGVTATDIEGIIQGAVDQILAGTAAIAGEVAQASTGEIVENPEIDPYKVGLSSVFPFCIPFDVYNMVTMFVAEPEAPSAEWSFTLPWSNQEYSVGWDLAAFDGVARVCRDMELVLFAVGLAVITYKVIKW